MTPTKFDEIVANEANKRVQAKIAAFRRALQDAVDALGVPQDCYDDHDHKRRLLIGEELGWKWDHKTNQRAGPSNVRRIFELVLSENPREGWPAYFWDKAREGVATELLAKLDVVQQAMLAPPPAATDCRPQSAGE